MINKPVRHVTKPTPDEKDELLSRSASCIRTVAHEISTQPPGVYKDMLCQEMMFLVHYRNSTLNLEVR